MTSSERTGVEDTPEMPATSRVDLTLIDAALRMSPEERLQHNDRMVTMAEGLRLGLLSLDGHG